MSTLGKIPLLFLKVDRLEAVNWDVKWSSKDMMEDAIALLALEAEGCYNP
jgi:hypothetical protein